MRRRARWVHGDPRQRLGDGQVWQEVATPCDRVDDLEAFVLLSLLSFEVRRDILAETQSARGGVDDDGKSSSVAPAPQRIGNSLRHELVPLVIGLRFPRRRAAKASDIRWNPQRLAGALGHGHEGLRKGRAGRAIRIATEHAIDARAEIDRRGTVPVGLWRTGSGTWHWPRHRRHQVRAYDSARGSGKSGEWLDSKQ